MTKSDPLVSVVIPVWNTGENVKKLVKALLQQSYRRLEIIIVDDGSSDDSLRVLQDLAKTDPRIKVIHQKNMGASAARNTGIDTARGKYVLFVDSDDDVREDYLEKMVQCMESDAGIDLVVSGVCYNKLQKNESKNVYLKPYNKKYGVKNRANFLLKSMIRDGRMYSVINKIFRLEIIKKWDLRFEEGRNFAEDTKFVLDYLRYAPGRVEFLLEPLYIYNFGTDTSTVKSSSTVWTNWEKSYQDLEEWVRDENEGKLGLDTWILLFLLRARWHVSHYRAKRRASSTAVRKP